MKIIVTAGGTGGHIYPALSIVEELKKQFFDVDILYIGTTDRIEKDIVPKRGIKYEGINIKGLIRKPSFENIKRSFLVVSSLSKVKELILDFDPDVIIGTGGYVSAPVLYMGRKLGYKTLIHEQNIIPGLTNKLLSIYVHKICVSFEEGKNSFPKKKVVYTGNPTTEKYQNAIPINKSKFSLSNDKKLILIVMGSLGSLTIINKMKSILPKLDNEKFEVVFVSGQNYYDEIKKIKLPHNIVVVPSIDNMGGFMKKTDIMVSRAGASTMAEIMALNVPTIFVPSPYVTNNHQVKNAKILTDSNAALMLEEEDFSYDSLIDKINFYLDDNNYNKCKENLENFKQINAAKKVVDEVIKLKEEI